MPSQQDPPTSSPIVDSKGHLNLVWWRWLQSLKASIIISAGVVSGATAGNFPSFTSTGDIEDSGKAKPSGVVLGTTDEQTLTNKTLTSPVMASFYQDAAKTKLMTAPATVSDTLVVLAAVQTLTNKTLTSPVLSHLTTSRLLSCDGSKIPQSVANLASWIAALDNTITVTDDGDGSISINVKIKADNGLTTDANGMFVKRKTGYGIDVDTDGLKLKQQTHEPDAVAVSAISLGAGADTVDRAAFNTALTTLVTEINAIKTVLNNLLLKQETAEVLASS